jgi:hypothetical protein
MAILAAVACAFLVAVLSAVQNRPGTISPQPEVAMQVAAAAFARPSRAESTLVIVVRLRDPAPPGATRAIETADVRIGAYDEKGAVRGSDQLQAKILLRPNARDDLEYEALARIDLPPGRYQLRLTAESGFQNTAGRAHFDLEVPDFSKAPVSLSGVVLNTWPRAMTVPEDRILSIIPVVPTAARDFAASQSVTAFLRAYQGGTAPLSPVSLTARIVDADGATAFNKTETLAPDAFSPDREADYRLQVPMKQLHAGAYRLIVEAARGSVTARREVAFTVR